MEQRGYRILIVGSGVAGLTAAIALTRAGHEVTIFEKAAKLQPLGAGLILWSNAISALRSLGMESAMREIGAPLTRLSIRTPDGSALSSTDARAIGQQVGAPTLAVHRADLLDVLLRTVGQDIIRLGHSLTGYRTEDGRVVAHFENGHEETGDLLLGADGIWSVVRSQIHGPSAPRYSGYTAWRSVISREPQRIYRTLESLETWGNGTRFGWVPLSQNRVYWFAVKATPPGKSRGPEGHRAELLNLFGDWHPPIPETIQASEESQILRHDIYDRPPFRNWGDGPVTLAGDAAHATTPNLGQGAALAIEDATLLAHCLNQYRTVETALRNYELQRQPRTSMITNQSLRMGMLAQIENPRAVWLRNQIMKVMPDSLTTSQIRQVVSWKPPESNQRGS